MKGSVVLWTALVALIAHPVRTGLTMLGIVIGVASVITVVAISTGAQREIDVRLQSIGANLLLVLPAADSGNPGRLTSDDAIAIRRDVRSLSAVAPSAFVRATAVMGNLNTEATVQGITRDYLVAREWPIASGRFFTPEEEARSAKVALLGATVTARLFGATDVANRVIRIDGVPFSVIGTVSPKGFSETGSDQDDRVFIPLKTVQHRLDGSRLARLGGIDYIMLKVNREQDMDQAISETAALLAQRRNRPFDELRIEIRDLAEALEARRESSTIFGRSLLAVALVSLLVGGISVMNIMLVAIAERTHEIGLRIAVGARPRDIRNQFLSEVLVMTLIAGVLGVLLGIVGAVITGHVADWPIVIEPWAVVAGMASACGTGLASGFYPVMRVAMLNPVLALRAG